MYTVRFTQQYKVVLALVLPALIVTPFIYLIAKYLPSLSDGSLGAVMCIIVGLPVALSFYLVKRASPIADLSLSGNSLQISFRNSNSFTPNDFELTVSDIHSYAVEVARNGYYFTIGCTVAPYTFSISTASNNDADEKIFLELMEKVGKLVDYQNNLQPIERQVKVTALRNMRWFWAMIIFSVIFLVMVVQLLKG